ncbi:DUF6335 family protein [Leptolyngbya sp. 7M]|uniref:DUF6335 family protein n=1 Tax=Leptolyngbya sp. 7M TaxID=2812896 RepID=UPI001B8B7817|nr:DUF6335 family protein [Leptolyngbya sp. 7M]QYO62995.1 hypothetical protein JVX88_23785 [Leptolyngbya sp. 7M]
MVDKANRFNQAKQKSYEAARRDVEAEVNRELSDDPTNLDELESLESDLGLEEVDLDQGVIDTVAADTSDDNLDADDDGIEDDEDTEELIDDRPQALTESYGTGLQGQPADRAGRYSRRSDHHLYNDPEPVLTGGDIDANYEQASVVGDEAVGGTVATPDQDVVDELGAAVGIEMDDRSFLRTGDMLEPSPARARATAS